MTIGYPWECKYCGAVNSAGTDRCAKCGNEAIARPIDTDPRFEKEREEFERRQRRLAPIPQPLRPVVAALLGIAMIGGVIAKFAWTIGATVIGLLIMAVAGIPAFIITKLHETPVPTRGQDDAH